MSRINIRLPQAPAEYNRGHMNRLINTIELQLAEINSSASTEPFQVSNVTTDRVLDANSTTLAEVADVLGTLITDLKEKGVIS
tara:strand:- start:239 stop:487 length:249 start_codon:yes stop_codon:yes gene_type:complete